jgi:hypothetical protein
MIAAARLAVVSTLIFAASLQVRAGAKPKTVSGGEPSNTSFLLMAEIVGSTQKIVWPGVFQRHDHPTRSNIEVIEQLKNNGLDQVVKIRMTGKAIYPYKTQMLDLLLRLRAAYFLTDELPFVGGTFNGKKCLLIMVATDAVYNTIRLSSKQRAASIVAKNILPTLKEMATSLGETDLGYYGVYIAYGSKDFVSGDDDALHAESVGVIVSAKDAAAYAENNLTDQNLLDKSTVLLSDRDSDDYSRVKLSLE